MSLEGPCQSVVGCCHPISERVGAHDIGPHHAAIGAGEVEDATGFVFEDGCAEVVGATAHEQDRRK
jgi:hypothetical protein